MLSTQITASDRAGRLVGMPSYAHLELVDRANVLAANAAFTRTDVRSFDKPTALGTRPWSRL